MAVNFNYRYFLSSKTRLVFGVLGVLLLVGIILRLITPPPQESYQSINPGRTTADEVVEIMGTPLNTGQEKGMDVLYYQSKYPNYPTRIFSEANKVELIIEPVTYKEKRMYSAIKEVLGEPDQIIYSKTIGPAYPGYVYQNKGVIIFTHQREGTVLEQWYFPPNKNVLEVSPEDLTSEPPYPQPE